MYERLEIDMCKTNVIKKMVLLLTIALITTSIPLSVNGNYALAETESSVSEEQVEDHSSTDSGIEELEENDQPSLEEILKQDFGVVNGKYYSKAVTIKFQNLTATLDNKTINTNYKCNVNGTHTLKLYHESSENPVKTIVFYYDDINPVIKGITNKKIYTNSVKITFNEGVAKIDNKTYKSGSSYKTPGEHKVVVTDKAGNVSTKSFILYKTTTVTDPYKAYSYSRMKKELNALEKQYPGLIDMSYYGKTVSQRKIPLVKLGKGKKKILIVGTVHAREYVTTSHIMKSIDYYAQCYAKDKKIEGADTRKVLDKVTFYFVPMLNIDGAEIVSHKIKSKYKKKAQKAVGKKTYKVTQNMWKANLRGADLNRNFPYAWKRRTNSPKKASYMMYKGKKAASEPETKAMIKLCKNNKFSHLFTMHTRGQIVYWRDNGNGAVPGDSKLAKKVRSINGYRLMPSTKNANGYGGGFENWFRHEYNRPALCIELTSVNQPYKSAPKNFNSCVWSKNKDLFIKTAL